MLRPVFGTKRSTEPLDAVARLIIPLVSTAVEQDRQTRTVRRVGHPRFHGVVVPRTRPPPIANGWCRGAQREWRVARIVRWSEMEDRA